MAQHVLLKDPHPLNDHPGKTKGGCLTLRVLEPTSVGDLALLGLSLNDEEPGTVSDWKQTFVC